MVIVLQGAGHQRPVVGRLVTRGSGRGRGGRRSQSPLPVRSAPRSGRVSDGSGRTSDGSGRVSVDQADQDVDDGALVLRALATLPDRHQEVISLRYLADLSPAETARALGIEKSHVAVRLHRAMTALRAAITAADPPGGVS